uniref:Death domain-containing protein n=1 Tax=Amphimedon queenslandica TaxID=400682 RepID=A0A1X7TF36_AMPQE
MTILSGRTLTPSDLDKVVDLLEKYHFSLKSYFDLGLYLHLSYSTLVEIKENNRRDIRSCFKECLASWLSGADGVENPTIDKLIAALEEIGEYAVAQYIDEERRREYDIIKPYSSLFIQHTCNNHF